MAAVWVDVVVELGNSSTTSKCYSVVVAVRANPVLCTLSPVLGSIQHAILHEHVLALWTAQQTVKFRVTPTTMRGQLRFFSAFIR